MYDFFVESGVKGLIVKKSKVKSILTRISTKNYNQQVFNCGYIYGLAKVDGNLLKTVIRPTLSAI